MDLFNGPDLDVARAIGVYDEDGDVPDASSLTSPVRPEYQLLAPHVLALCRDFGLTVDMVHELNLDALMRSFECLDRHYDAISDDGAAEQFVEDVFLFLRSRNSVRPIRPLRLPVELTSQLASLREVLIQTGTLNVFFEHISHITQTSRDARKVREVREFVRCSLTQGELTGALVLKVLDFENPPEHFVPFMTYVAATGKLFDHYRGADRHFESRQMIIKPGFLFKNYIRVLLLERIAWIVAHHPNKTRALQDAGDILHIV